MPKSLKTKKGSQTCKSTGYNVYLVFKKNNTDSRFRREWRWFSVVNLKPNDLKTRAHPLNFCNKKCNVIENEVLNHMSPLLLLCYKQYKSKVVPFLERSMKFWLLKKLTLQILWKFILIQVAPDLDIYALKLPQSPPQKKSWGGVLNII